MKIVLISPKGPLYRHKGGIFKKSLRYQPLTLTTLAALVPAELNATVELIDEGIEEVPKDLTADLIGMTVITGTARRSYELAKRFRDQGIPVVLGGPHVTLIPDEASEHADAICIGYAEESWPQLLRDFSCGAMQKIYRQSPTMSLENMPFPRRDLFNKNHFLTQAVFEATLNAYVAAVPQPCASRRFPRVQSCISMAGTPPSPPVDAGCASCAACIRSSFAKSCAGCASMRRQRFTGGGREVATVTVASGTVTVAISTCCGNCNPHPARVATNTARDICYAKRVANCSNAVWPRYSERDKCNALVPEWFTKRTFSLFYQAVPKQ